MSTETPNHPGGGVMASNIAAELQARLTPELSGGGAVRLNDGLG